MNWINKEKKLRREKNQQTNRIEVDRENGLENKQRTIQKIRVKMHRRNISNKKLIGYIYFI